MQICESILQATQDGGMAGIQVTTLMTKANMPHPRLTKFMNKLIGNELVNRIEVKGKHTFIITEKGRIYLEKYKQFADLAGTFGLDL
jgi:predicted transcriptional regulator